MIGVKAGQWLGLNLYHIEIFTAFNISWHSAFRLISERSIEFSGGGKMRFATLMIFLCVFTGCSTQGDFGRDQSSQFNDDMLRSIRNFVASSQDQPTTSFTLTKKERMLHMYHRRISRDMKYPTVESKYTYTVASVGLVEQPLPYLGKDIRGRENAKKPVVDILASAKKNPYSLRNEIEEDIIIVRRVRALHEVILADDRLRTARLAAMASATQVDKDNVFVRARKNRNKFNYIQHVAKLRVVRYRRAIDVMSIADTDINLNPPKSSLDILELELNYTARKTGMPRKLNPARLLNSA